MRDIRIDLRERLSALNESYLCEMSGYDEKREALEQEHRNKISTLERERVATEQMLTIEEQRHGALPLAAASKAMGHLVALPDFLITKVFSHGPMDKDQLRAEAALAGYENGRKFHTTLMNITNGGKLVLAGDGRYAFPHRSTSLFEPGESNESQPIM